MEMFCRQCEQTAGGKGCTIKGVCGKTPETKPITTWTTPTLPKEWEHFEPAPPKVQLDDVDRWKRREGIETLTEVQIKVSGSSDAATQFRNLIRLAKAGKKIQTKVEITVRTYQTNLTLDATFSADDEGMENPAAKFMDDIARWNLPEFEATLTLKADKIEVNELQKLLKNTLKTENSNTKLSLELKPKQVK